MTRSIHIHIDGVVQGVGFRPYIYRLARRHRLSGWVRNSSAGVEVAAEGAADAIGAFVDAIPRELPPQAAIDSLAVADAAPAGCGGFSILESSSQPGVTRISPDIAVCGDCLRELADPGDRRRGYPFINCTNCGPRFSIIEGTPYDRPMTSMRAFAMCPECRREYDDPADRRFHAQPNACPACGPAVSFRDRDGGELSRAGPALAQAAEALLQGRIVAIKGIGGYHLACDAHSPGAVARLRERKRRPDKPLAVMCPDLEAARGLCLATPQEERLLASAPAPIVLLRSRRALPDEVAPQNLYLGVMLPSAPLHHALFRELRQRRPGLAALVMTSGNAQDQPVIGDDGQALAQLAGVADAFLTHDREVVNRCDDSIAMAWDGAAAGGGYQIIRHARGYAPDPIRLPVALPPTLAVGAQMKNCFALAAGDRAFVSQHIGEADNLGTMDFFEEMVAKYRRWFGITPRVIVHDRHPDYLTTRWACQQTEAGHRAVQHHRAHILSVLADNLVDEPVIGVAFDGTGYGDDGTIWGGEFFVTDPRAEHGLGRAGHIECLPLPGGEAAIRKPYRIAAAYCRRLLGEIPAGLFDSVPEGELQVVALQAETGANTVMTSSMGRLFDAASALLGIRRTSTFEAQAAMALEQACRPGEQGSYPFSIVGGVVGLGPLWSQLAADRLAGVPPAVCAARFHNTVIDFTAAMCDNLKLRTGIRRAALSGGVFQNRLLLRTLSARLEQRGFTVHVNRQVPSNDGGIALGQLLAAAENR